MKLSDSHTNPFRIWIDFKSLAVRVANILTFGLEEIQFVCFSACLHNPMNRVGVNGHLGYKGCDMDLPTSKFLHNLTRGKDSCYWSISSNEQ